MAYLSKEEKQKIKNALKIKKSLDKEIDDHNLRVSSPEPEDVDFKKVIHPLGFYIHDREQMIEEIFSIIKGEKLRKMLPPILKNCTLEELKADCLVHLLGMSRKRILAILEGRELNSSSDSESESSTITSDSDEALKPSINKLESRSNIDEDDLLDISVSKNDVDSLTRDQPKVSTKLNKTKVRLRKKIKTEKDDPVCSIIISDDDFDDTNNKKTKKLNRERASNKLDKILGNKEKVRKHKKIENFAKNKVSKNIALSTNNVEKQIASKDDTVLPDKNEKGKTLLEILELEMRARAIRALLKNTPDAEETDSVLSDNLKSEKGASSNSKIPSAIAEVIDQTLSAKNHTATPSDNVSESGNDVEIIDVTDVDLCVTIDDDDEISTETHSENSVLRINVDAKSEPLKDKSEKSEPLKSKSEKSEPSKDKSEKSKPLKNMSEKAESSKDKSQKSKPLRGRSEKSEPLADKSEKCETATANNDELNKSESLREDNSEKAEASKENCAETWESSVENGAEKCESSMENVVENCGPSERTDADKHVVSAKQNDAEECDLTTEISVEKSEGERSNATENVSWSERWAENKNVKEIVKNSKICANIRKRMRFARMLKQKQSEETKQKNNEIQLGNVEESSVAHYNLIKAYGAKNTENSNDDTKSIDEQKDPVEKLNEEKAKIDDTDSNISTEDHTLTILENDPKTLIIDISDDDITSISSPIGDS